MHNFCDRNVCAHDCSLGRLAHYKSKGKESNCSIKNIFAFDQLNTPFKCGKKCNFWLKVSPKPVTESGVRETAPGIS